MSQTAWENPCTVFIRSNDRNGSPLTRVTLRPPCSGSTTEATLNPSPWWSLPVRSPRKSVDG